MLTILRAATVADIDELLDLWQEAAENAARQPILARRYWPCLATQANALVLDKTIWASNYGGPAATSGKPTGTAR
jgi:hypothetical protein